jgi:hypothetical protein
MRACRHKLLAVGLLFGFAQGCGDGSGVDALRGSRLYPVNGKVLLHDGSPLSKGSVEFVNISGPAISSTGRLGPDGAFTLKTEGLGEGALAGEYRVHIVPDDSDYVAKKIRNVQARILDKHKVPYAPKYTEEDASGLTAVVKPQDNQLEPFRLAAK